MRVNLHKLTFLTIVVLTIVSCDQSRDFDMSQLEKSEVDNPTMEEIIRIAETQAPWSHSSNGRVAKNKVSRQILSLPRKSTKPIMHIINYAENGFIIVAADKRISPVLAYSDEGSFIDNEVIPGGIVSWMSSVAEAITDIRKSEISQDETVKRIWKRYIEIDVLSGSISASGRTGTTVYIGDCNNGDSGFTEYSTGLATTATWNQGSGYNELLPNAGCAQTGNGRYWTGCVATATAEIMRFYSHPSSYNWTTMPLNSGSAETSRLMRDIGTPGNLSMEYGCEGSGAYSDNIPRTLLNFGFSAASYVNYNMWTAKGYLQGGWPIILSGRESFWDDFTPSGHAWVADGVQYWGYYDCAPDPNTPGEWIQNFTGYDCSMRMNWGWGGSYNGWYSANGFNPGGHDFNYGRKMVVGIQP